MKFFIKRISQLLKSIRFPTAIIICLVALTSCAKEEQVTEENGNIITKKKRIEPNVLKRAESARDKGGGIFNNAMNRQTTFDFATSNVLWRATLESIDFIPLNNVDYSGGVIVSDWYSVENSNDSIKLTVRFLSSDVKASSVKVINHKKICKNDNCKIIKGDNNLNTKIKKNILKLARELKIKDEQKKAKK